MTSLQKPSTQKKASQVIVHFESLSNWVEKVKLQDTINPHQLINPSLLYLFLERTLNISCKDSFSQCVILLHSNLCHVGELKSNYFQFGRHDLTHCYISCGPPQLKCPSIPYASGSGNGDLEGLKQKSFFILYEERKKLPFLSPLCFPFHQVTTSQINPLNWHHTTMFQNRCNVLPLQALQTFHLIRGLLEVKKKIFKIIFLLSIDLDFLFKSALSFLQVSSSYHLTSQQKWLKTIKLALMPIVIAALLFYQDLFQMVVPQIST